MIVAIIFRCILWCLGWQLMPPETLNYLAKWDRIVVVFSHTSYIDFYIMILYMLAYPRELKFVKILVKPQPFKYAGWLLRKFGAIPATRVDSNQGGAVARIVEELQKDDRTLFLISPKGTIVRREWRSGYYHIAKALKAPLMASGLDYEHRTIVISDVVSFEEPESVVKDHLYERLGQIVPLFPCEEVVTIRSHSNRAVANWSRMLTVMIVVGCVVNYCK
jgi:hypothetical protein